MAQCKAEGKLNEQTQELRKSINTFVTGQGAQNPFLQNNPFAPKNQTQTQQTNTPTTNDTKTPER